MLASQGLSGDIHSPRYPLHYPTNAYAEYNLVNDVMGKNGRVKVVFDDYSINGQTILVSDLHSLPNTIIHNSHRIGKTAAKMHSRGHKTPL
jgi:hypothetical protein